MDEEHHSATMKVSTKVGKGRVLNQVKTLSKFRCNGKQTKIKTIRWCQIFCLPQLVVMEKPLTGSAVITHNVTTGTGYCLVGFNWIIDFLN